MRASLRLPRCSLLDVACLALPVWLAIMATHTAADADLWGHLRFGSDLLIGHGLSPSDPYSFTADTPWINHEWLSEVVLAAFYKGAGAFGLNVLKLTIIGLIGLLMWRAGERAGGSRRTLVLLTSVVLFASYTRTQVLRPQLFSVVLFTILLTLLEGGDYRAFGVRPSAFTVPLLFLVWSNMHGGWIVGAVTLAIWLFFDVVEKPGLRTCVRGATLMLASLAATLVNPYGVRQWAFLHQTVGLSRDISDWTPFAKFPHWLIAFELVLPLVALNALRSSRRWPTARQATVIGALAFGTWRVGRVDAFLQIAIGLLLAPLLVQYFGRLERGLCRYPRLAAPSTLHGLALAATVVVTVAATARNLGRVYVEGPWTPDREAARFLRAKSSNTRLLTWFDWGEYAIWHLSPAGIRVSMDGRRETVYSDRVLGDHWAFYKNADNAWRYPDVIGADQIWLPKRLPIVPILRARGWHVAFESDLSVVFARNGPDETRVTRASQEEASFFPGS